MTRKTANNKGFTIIEIMVAMVIFLIVLAIATGGIINILQFGVRTFRSEVSNTEGIVGLEILKHDLQATGYGLFYNESDVPTYLEASNQLAITNAPQISYDSFNDGSASAATTKQPRLLAASNDTNGICTTDACQKPDYLVLKSTSLGNSLASQKWTTRDGSGETRLSNFNANDWVVVLDETEHTYIDMLTFNNIPMPVTSKRYTVFGLDDPAATTAPRAPFNRVDYFVRRDADTPATCSPASGRLYRAIMSQKDGKFKETPIMDCVADMQVVFGINTTANPETDLSVQHFAHADFSTTLIRDDAKKGEETFYPTDENSKDPNWLRGRVKLVIIYLMVQDGPKDLKFTNDNPPASELDRHIMLGAAYDPAPNDPNDLSKLTSFNKYINLYNGYTRLPGGATKSPNTDNYRNYRWKVYRVVVALRNS